MSLPLFGGTSTSSNQTTPPKRVKRHQNRRTARGVSRVRRRRQGHRMVPLRGWTLTETAPVRQTQRRLLHADEGGPARGTGEAPAPGGESKIYGLKGTWGYHEYDWVGKAGDFVTEVPGTVHTMYMNKGSEIMFTLIGPIDYYSEDGSLTETLDAFSFWRLFSEHLEGLGKVANVKLWD